MGLKIKKSEITNYLNQTSSSLTKKNDSLNQIMQGLQRFIEAPELTGEAWSSAKKYTEAVHIPLLRGQIRANEEIITDNQTFSSRIAEKINNEIINEDVIVPQIYELNKTLQDKQFKNQQLLRSLSPINSSSHYFFEERLIRKLKKDIESLRELENSCTDLYITAEQLLNNVNQGMSALSKANCFNSSTGFYSTSNLKLDWANGINANWNTSRLEGKLPSDLEKKIQDIKNSDLSAVEKADEITAIYENYLYSLNKKGFDEYDKIRLEFGVGSKEEINAKEKLASELQIIDLDIKAIARSLGDDIVEVSGRNTLNYVQFIDMVNTGRPLDLKSRQFGESGYSIWSRDWSSDFIIDGEDRSADYLGNYLFGYYGQGALYFDGETLKMGAGLAQIKSDGGWKLFSYGFGFFVSPIITTVVWGFNGYGDNSDDGIMIQDGIDDFIKFNK